MYLESRAVRTLTTCSIFLTSLFKNYLLEIVPYPLKMIISQVFFEKQNTKRTHFIVYFSENFVKKKQNKISPRDKDE